jgi:hypothetical protein
MKEWVSEGPATRRLVVKETICGSGSIGKARTGGRSLSMFLAPTQDSRNEPNRSFRINTRQRGVRRLESGFKRLRGLSAAQNPQLGRARPRTMDGKGEAQ